jgi:phosphatidate cytidylyltransferase
VNLVWRTLTALVLIPAVAWLILRGSDAAVAAVLGLVILAAQGEWFAMHGHRGPLSWLPVLLGGLGPLGCLGVGGERFWHLYPFLFLLLAVLAGLAGGDPLPQRQRRAVDVAGSFLFVAAPLTTFTAILALERGRALVLFLLAVTWTVDTLAYAAGRIFGKHPLAPLLSPKKTLEGLAGAALGGMAGGVLLGRALLELPPAAALVLGLAVALLGQAGDLFESLWKRSAGVKDSGALIPGHGGILDRTDSLLLTAPLLYHGWRFWMEA